MATIIYYFIILLFYYLNNYRQMGYRTDLFFGQEEIEIKGEGYKILIVCFKDGYIDNTCQIKEMKGYSKGENICKYLQWVLSKQEISVFYCDFFI